MSGDYTLREMADKLFDGVDSVENVGLSLDQIVGALVGIRETLDDICDRGRLHVDTHPAP